MLLNFFNTIKKFNWAMIISIILFIIPFFWFKAEAMDLGGDGTRLYFYDPQAFIKNAALYAVDPHGRGYLEPRQAYLVYVGFLAFIKKFVVSGHNLIAIFNCIKLSFGFLSIYFFVKEFILADTLIKILF